MNKTVTINISGIIFHIEEDAYEKLSKYLSTIKGLFSKADGGNEIMSDIEARIAEMLQSKTSAVKQVVLMADVDYVMESMGKPEDFAGDQASADGSSETESGYSSSDTVKKRLFRDGDSKVLGGVCSGIGHYFGFDPVWLRIVLLLLFFFAGSGFLLYIILWIAIPEAKTTADKLAMKGEKADINNISKAVKEEAEQLKKRMEKYGKDFQNMSNGAAPRNAVERTVDFIADVLGNIGRVLLKVIGILMVILGVIFFLGLFSTVFGVSFMTNMEGQEWIDMLLLDGKDLYIGLIGIAIFVGTPIIMMIYGGVKLLLKVKYYNRWLNLSAGLLWLVGFIMLLYVGMRTGQDFNKVAKVREEIAVVPHDTLVLKMRELPVNHGELQVSDDEEEGERGFVNYRRRNNGNFIIGKKQNKELYLLGYPSVNVIKSQNNKVELVVVKEARGNAKEIARLRAKHISYNIGQAGSELLFDNIFTVNSVDKFRQQDVTAVLKIPVGTVIYLDQSMENLIYDIENITNTYDGDMINRRWMMTEEGLKCVDCNGLISVKDHYNGKKNDDDNDDEDERVKINVNGVNINAKDASIKVDSSGVNINSKESKVVIDKNGVHVNTKK